MTQEVWKFEAPRAGVVLTLEMPKDAEILKIENGNMWALIPDTKAKRVDRVFETFGTNWEIPLGNNYQYLGTYFTAKETFVWHVFELTSRKPIPRALF